MSGQALGDGKDMKNSQLKWQEILNDIFTMRAEN